jgi:hypothetical protein
MTTYIERGQRHLYKSPIVFRIEDAVIDQVGEIIDISKAGLKFITESAITPKSRINITKVGWVKKDQLFKRMPPSRVAEVKWCRKERNEHDSCYSTGIEYCHTEKLKTKELTAYSYLRRRILEISEAVRLLIASLLFVFFLFELWLLAGSENNTFFKSLENIFLMCLPGLIVVLVSVIVGYMYLRFFGIKPSDKIESLVDKTVDVVNEKNAEKKRHSNLEGFWVYTLKNEETDMEICCTFDLRYAPDHEIKVQGQCWYYDTPPEENNIRGRWNSIFVSFNKETLLIVYEMTIQREMIHGKLQNAAPCSSYKGIIQMNVQGEPTIQTGSGFCVGAVLKTPISGVISAYATHQTNKLSSKEIVDVIKKFLDADYSEERVLRRFHEYIKSNKFYRFYQWGSEDFWVDFFKENHSISSKLFDLSRFYNYFKKSI